MIVSYASCVWYGDGDCSKSIDRTNKCFHRNLNDIYNMNAVIAFYHNFKKILQPSPSVILPDILVYIYFQEDWYILKNIHTESCYQYL